MNPDDIKTIQTPLRGKGLYNGAIDGQMGLETNQGLQAEPGHDAVHVKQARDQRLLDAQISTQKAAAQGEQDRQNASQQAAFAERQKATDSLAPKLKARLVGVTDPVKQQDIITGYNKAQDAAASRSALIRAMAAGQSAADGILPHETPSS